MNLISGEIMNRKQSLERLENIRESVSRTLFNGDLPVQKVINACDTLSKRMNEAEHLPLLLSLGMTMEKARAELESVRQMMSREYLESRLRIEFCGARDSETEFLPFAGKARVRQSWKPLGVLLHIAAGNVDALPVFSVIEGLLSGNINLLKLPGSDDGLSIAILKKLIEIEPLLADYVYVFDYPSEDIESMKKMACAADTIVVWGGDDAVSAVRRMADANTKIIEWGHKISFAYISDTDCGDGALEGIAYNICDTGQLFCNSCQGLYLNTADFNEVAAFSKRFLSILDRVALSMPEKFDPFLRAQKTLELATERLESPAKKRQVFQTANCSVIACSDSLLEPSYKFRNCWIKPLPKEQLLLNLLPHKNHLQTAALLCKEEERAALENMLQKTGIVRITSGENMSKSYCGMPHDGEFPLRRYMKTVSFEY
ncbi:MAG: acyl-CoA reductase [Christensenellales bacterium]